MIKSIYLRLYYKDRGSKTKRRDEVKDAPVKDGPFDQRRLVSRDIIHSAHLYLNLPPAPGFLTPPPRKRLNTKRE